MQVATLFRETATLLGASMEAQEPPGSETQGMKLSSVFPGNDVAMKQEPQDDGYETSGDLELRSQGQGVDPSRHVHGGTHLPPMVKREPPDDPYSFVDDDPTPTAAPQVRGPVQPVVLQPVPKKRGRKKKVIQEGLENTENLMNGHGAVFKGKILKDGKFPPVFKERKKHDRFNGMPEEEVSKRTLPDHLTLNLDIVIVGINPGLFAAYKGHHYAGPGNHFWKCLYLSGLTSEPLTADDDFKLLQVGIGFTNMVSRATKGSADLTRKEIKEGSQLLLEKLQKYKPKIAVFNGKLIFEVFSGKKDFSFGRQPEFVEGTNTYMWVMPSSSARCAQLPRAADKVPFYAALKKFRDYLNGMISSLDEAEVVFTDSKLKNYFEREVKEEPKEEHTFYGYGRLPNNGELTDLSNAIVKKEDQQIPAKKKRGRPKKIKPEGELGEAPPKKSTPRKTQCDNVDAPKKKRGRPKKVKTEDAGLNVSSNGLSDHTNSSATLSNCFSPPIQSPTNFNQQSFQYNQSQQSYSNQLCQSPAEPANYHQSPAQSGHYSQSPAPPSQPFTHSDLSSEISAAISSERGLTSPSPSLGPLDGPPDFDPPASMADDTSNPKQDELAPEECRFSPAESNEAQGSALNAYQGYGGFPSEPVVGGPGPGYRGSPVRAPNQDVSAKSLSGLESLVDQIPSIAEGEPSHHPATVAPEDDFNPSSQYNAVTDTTYLTGYQTGSQYSTPTNYTPNFTSASTNYAVSTSSNSYSLHGGSAMNFSVSSLANSSHAVPPNHESNSFSVSSLAASNYASSMNSPVNSGYPNLMGGPHTMGGHMGPPAMFGMDRTCGIPMGSMNVPYPYGQYSHPHPGGSPVYGGYPPTHGLHMPSPNYPYPSPYSNASSYPQPSVPAYLPNHVLDRIKQERMDITFPSGF